LRIGQGLSHGRRHHLRLVCRTRTLASPLHEYHHHAPRTTHHAPPPPPPPPPLATHSRTTTIGHPLTHLPPLHPPPLLPSPVKALTWTLAGSRSFRSAPTLTRSGGPSRTKQLARTSRWCWKWQPKRLKYLSSQACTVQSRSIPSSKFQQRGSSLVSPLVVFMIGRTTNPSLNQVYRASILTLYYNSTVLNRPISAKGSEPQLTNLRNTML
jgi:hypothetical protein